ncbi:hypothetical protein JCM16163A_09240 [Paenibacillus sp. YK5]|nr:hypothetical protein PN4B1_32240 [Paenibacillus naphthalenovorans]
MEEEDEEEQPAASSETAAVKAMHIMNGLDFFNIFLTPLSICKPYWLPLTELEVSNLQASFVNQNW